MHPFRHVIQDPILIVLGSAGVLAIAGVLTAIFISLSGRVTYTNEGTKICTQQRDASHCTDVSREAVGKLARMDLPDGTVIESASYQQFQDWHLEATFVVPSGRVGEWEASLGQYAAPDRESCQGLPDLGPDQECAGTDSTGPIQYRYARAGLADGSVSVAVDVASF